MKRKQFTPRLNLAEEHQAVGFDFGSVLNADGTPYWTEGVGYEFTLQEIDALEAASNELHEIAMDYVQSIITTGDYPSSYQFSNVAKQAIEESWKRRDPYLYGRFDFAYNDGKISLLEYNADTPTSLLEASVVQWKWVMETEGVPNRDQFNSIHEALISRWEFIATKLPILNKRIHFCATNVAGSEDWGTLAYLIDTALQAGITAYEMPIENMIYAPGKFLDDLGDTISHVFKLYPWEWMMQEEFNTVFNSASTRWIEPPWKLLLSNKVLLAQLWDRYRDKCGYLLPAFVMDSTGIPSSGNWVCKPSTGREGANVAVFTDGHLAENSEHFVEEYAKGINVIQMRADLPNFDGAYPIIGSWMIGDASVGIGIREGKFITTDGSHFVPHYFI